MGPLPDGESILVLVAYYSRYYEVDILKSTTAEKVISSLEVMFSKHGLPESLTSDNIGPQFISAEFKKCMEKQGIRHHRTTAKWPQANEQVERQNLSLLKRIQIAHAEKQDWKKELTKYLTVYRSLPHPTTGVSPAELLFGRKICTKPPELSDVHVEHEVRDRDSEQKSKCKAYADARRNASYSDVLPFIDQVLVQQEKRNKFSTPFNPNPFMVVSKHGNSLVVQSQDGAEYSRNTSHVHVKKLQSNEKENETRKLPIIPKEVVLPQDKNGMDKIDQEQPSSKPAQPRSSPTLRRSERRRAAPQYHKDYVT